MNGVATGTRCHSGSCHKQLKNGVFVEQNGHRYCDIKCFKKYLSRVRDGSDGQKESFRRVYQNRKKRQRPVDSTTSQVANLKDSLKSQLSNSVQDALSSDYFIVMDTEMKNGVGHWASNWDHMSEVYAIKFQGSEYVELYWSVEYIEASFPSDLKQEWMDFCFGITFVWYYGVSRCDEIRMEYLLSEDESYDFEWMDAQTKIAQLIMTTDVIDKSKIYVQALGLAFQEDSFIYPGDVSIIGDFQLENSDKLKSMT